LAARPARAGPHARRDTEIKTVYSSRPLGTPLSQSTTGLWRTV
jgi:hypothetical protein